MSFKLFYVDFYVLNFVLLDLNMAYAMKQPLFSAQAVKKCSQNQTLNSTTVERY